MRSNVHAFPGLGAPRRAGWLERAGGSIGAWRQRRRRRRELEAMDDALLADIGIGRDDIPRVVAGGAPPDPVPLRTGLRAC